MDMLRPNPTERTFQGILFTTINKILKENNLNFSYITQEENIGLRKSRFADGLLYSKNDKRNKILFELKNVYWDASDETLVLDAMQKAFEVGIKFFVTGTPRQLIIFQTFKPGTTLYERKLKIFNISNIKKHTEVTQSYYEKQITLKLIEFLKELESIVFEKKEIFWDSIDVFFVNKLSAYILEASYDMSEIMYNRIQKDNLFKKNLLNYLKNQDLFNISLKFNKEDVYKISQLANYLFYLKIIFYICLCRDVPELNLKEIIEPKDVENLNTILNSRFKEVLKYDYQQIFESSILDDFEFGEYKKTVINNINELKKIDYKNFNADIIGEIYNTLIDNQEQHHRGQHFTNINEVDIINSFCIINENALILDSGCGAGTFLVRAYVLLKNLNPKLKHEILLEKLWGIEIATFPVFLSSINLSLLEIINLNNYPIIIQKDFSEINSKSYHKFHTVRFNNEDSYYQIKKIDAEYSKVEIPVFDVCVGNPPYIRHELIENKKRWSSLLKKEYGINKIDHRSDLYVYYLIHTSSFLKNEGRMGYVISSSWLDVSFGRDLQLFLFNNFKIIAIIENQKIRSFATASINTVILILEKCNNIELRKSNNIKFVRVFKSYNEIFGRNDDSNRFEKINKFINTIKKEKKNIKTDLLSITIKNQHELRMETTKQGKYLNGNWGAKYLRSPEIYNKILHKGKNKLIPLRHFAEIKYGIKSGANRFFYLQDNTEDIHKMSPENLILHFGESENYKKKFEKDYGWFYSELTKRHYVFEKQYFRDILKTQKEVKNLDVELNGLKYKVLVIEDTKGVLKRKNSKLISYISEGENKPFELHKRPTCQSRIQKDRKRDWFNLSQDCVIGDFIFPSKIGEKFRLIDNRKSKVFCDKVNYNIIIKKQYKKYSDFIFLILNSTVFRLFIDLYARQLTGNQTISDVDVNIVSNTLIVNPELLNPFNKELRNLYNSFKGRSQETIFKEIEKEDRKNLDEIILKTLGLDTNDLYILYDSVIEYIKERKIKSNSVYTNKKKIKLNYNDSLTIMEDRFPEINKYSEITSGMKLEAYNIPNMKTKFPKDIFMKIEDMFGYTLIFYNEYETISVEFSNLDQLILIEFLYENLDIKGTKIDLPVNKEDCIKVIEILKKDFLKYSNQIRILLKTYRSEAHFSSIYKDLLFQE